MLKKVNKDYVIYAVSLVILITTYFFGFVKVSGQSMYPSINDGQNLIRQSHFYDVDRFDVVVIKANSEHRALIKRVIGMPGDTVQIREGELFINGKYVKQDFTYMIQSFDVNEFVVPTDKYYVLGDNRPNSMDSRVFGLIDQRDLMGVVLDENSKE